MLAERLRRWDCLRPFTILFPFKIADQIADQITRADIMSEHPVLRYIPAGAWALVSLSRPLSFKVIRESERADRYKLQVEHLVSNRAKTLLAILIDFLEVGLSPLSYHNAY